MPPPSEAFKLWQRVSLLGLALPWWCFSCVFQPSWAKGWPGISQAFVFSTSFAVVTFLGIFGLGGAATFIITKLQRPDRLRWWQFFGVLLPTLIAGLFLGWMAFSYAFSWTVSGSYAATTYPAALSGFTTMAFSSRRSGSRPRISCCASCLM